MTRAYLGLGGNIGKPRQAMSEALRRLDRSRVCRLRQCRRSTAPLPGA